MVGELVNTYRGRGNDWSGNRYHFSPGRGIGGRSNLDRGINTAPENDAEIFPAHYTWKVAEKGFKIAFRMNRLEMINSCEIILEK